MTTEIDANDSAGHSFNLGLHSQGGIEEEASIHGLIYSRGVWVGLEPAGALIDGLSDRRAIVDKFISRTI